jgi:pantetheine-phosphate adenylyltransferase
MARAARRAVYAGSFDPVTKGHLYVIREGAKLFDELVVAVGDNPEKKYRFTAGERAAMLEAAIEGAGIRGVRVMPLGHSYVVEFASGVGASYVLRGMRSQADYAFEQTLRNVNGDMRPEITTVFVMPPRELADVSSSFVMGLVGPAGWQRVVRKYLPEEVCRALEAREAKS